MKRIAVQNVHDINWLISAFYQSLNFAQVLSGKWRPNRWVIEEKQDYLQIPDNLKVSIFLVKIEKLLIETTGSLHIFSFFSYTSVCGVRTYYVNAILKIKLDS